MTQTLPRAESAFLRQSLFLLCFLSKHSTQFACNNRCRAGDYYPEAESDSESGSDQLQATKSKTMIIVKGEKLVKCEVTIDLCRFIKVLSLFHRDDGASDLNNTDSYRG